jgi:hypothetical protein
MLACEGTAARSICFAAARAESAAVSALAAPQRRSPRCPRQAAHPGSAGTPSPGSPAPSARSMPRPANPRAVCRRGVDKSIACGPAAGASEAACPLRTAGWSAMTWGAAGPAQPAPPDQPSPALAWGAAAAAPPPPDAAPAARRPSLPTSAPAAPSTRSDRRISGRASVRSQARDAASHTTTTAAKPAGQPLRSRFGTLQARMPAQTLSAW